MAVFSGFRPFLTKGSTLNGVQNTFFADSVNGVHYVPDTADVYGATGVAAPSESIGAVFDEKNGVPTFGPNLIINGTFDTDLTGWSFNTTGNGTQAVVSGAVSLSSAKNYPTDRAGIYQSLNLTRGTYLLEFDVIERDISFFWAFVGTVYGASDISGNGYSPAVGRAAMVLHIPGGNTWLEWRISGTAKFDNLSLRLLSGNAAIQNTVAARPLVGRAPRSVRNVLTFSMPQNISVWTSGASDFTATTGVSFLPEGAQFTGTTSRLTRTIGGLLSVAATFSFYVKSVSNSVLTLTYRNPSSGNSTISYNPIAKTVTQSGSQFLLPTLTIISSDTVRIMLPFSVLVGANCQISITGGGAGDIITDFQWERGSVTSYQKVEATTNITESAVTLYPFIRMDLSDDILTTSNLVSAKNLLRFTEEFDNAAWSKVSATVTSNVTAAPDGLITADALVPSAVESRNLRYTPGFVPTGFPYTVSVYAKANQLDQVTLYIRRGVNDRSYGPFDLTNVTVTASGEPTIVSNLQITDVGNGWRRLSAVCNDINITVFGFGASGAAGVNSSNSLFLWGAQLELGSTVTAYEYGGLKGTVLVAGRSGTAIENITLPDGIFSLGPATYTGGTTGILRAVGDIVGYTVTGRTTTSIEQDLLIDFYKFRGAKGSLVPRGPELITNGDFTSNLSGWVNNYELTEPDNSYFWDNGVAKSRFATGGRNSRLLYQDIPTTIGRAYKVTWGMVSSSAATLVGIGLATGSVAEYVGIITATTTTTRIQCSLNNVQLAYIDRVSVVELRPKEEW